ncbi:MAG: carboxypeptidase regulatory-like domain-containing protein, partial [bacterium]|nr:carboxypeptidase regulatory-like domain-containing protein [Candidatus Kapabacteria bacterium]
MTICVPGIRAIALLALLLITAPLAAQTRASFDDHSMHEVSVAGTLRALGAIRGVDYKRAQPSATHSARSVYSNLFSSVEGSISGTVTFPVGIKESASILAVAADSDRDSYYMASTGSRGEYTIDGVTAGSYIVFAQAIGCDAEFYDNVPSAYEATYVTVRDGQVTEKIDFSLEETPVGTGAITGTVRSESGVAIAGAQIRATSVDGLTNVSWAYSDEFGDFELSGMFSGSYYVEASAEGFIGEVFENASSYSDATTVVVSEPDATSDIEFSLSPGAIITGRIVDVDGNPIVGVMVEASSGKRDSPDSTVTDPSPPVYNGSTDYSDEDGRYIIGGLEDGDYIVSASVWGPWVGITEWYDNATSFSDATLVRARINQTTSGIDFVLDVPSFDGVIRGVITDSSGAPIEGAYVGADAGKERGPGIQTGTITGADGTFVIEGLPDGEYMVNASAQSGWTMAMRWWRDAETPDDADVVSITDGVTNVASVDIRLPLVRGTSSISGTVTLGSGGVLAEATVGVIVTDPSDSTVVYGVNAYTDEQGRYTIPFLPAGSYMVYATHWMDDKMGTAWFDNAADASTATAIVLTDDEKRTGIDFSLEMKSYRGMISGRVTDDVTGAPIA